MNRIGLLAFIVAVLLPQSGGFGPEAQIGWPNRLFLVANDAWLMTVAWRANRLDR